MTSYLKTVTSWFLSAMWFDRMTQRFSGQRKQKASCLGLVCLVKGKRLTGRSMKNSNVLYIVLKHNPRSSRSICVQWRTLALCFQDCSLNPVSSRGERWCILWQQRSKKGQTHCCQAPFETLKHLSPLLNWELNFVSTFKPDSVVLKISWMYAWS